MVRDVVHSRVRVVVLNALIRIIIMFVGYDIVLLAKLVSFLFSPASPTFTPYTYPSAPRCAFSP